MLRVDLNCDLGEGCGNDAALMRLITSANIACGQHAGDADTMRRTIDLALDAGVNIGAHPGYPDRGNFGRTDMPLSPADTYKLVSEQIATLADIVHVAGATVRHVKPHGALYNQSAKDTELAAAIAEAVHDHDPALILFGLSGSLSIAEAEKRGIRTAAEAFADRTYQADGTLTPRSDSKALITDESVAAAQAVEIVMERRVDTTNGTKIPIRADTICLHGDSPVAVKLAYAVRKEFERNGIVISGL